MTDIVSIDPKTLTIKVEQNGERVAKLLLEAIELEKKMRIIVDDAIVAVEYDVENFVLHGDRKEVEEMLNELKETRT